MTNLHFHGLEISPQSPQDDVIDMIGHAQRHAALRPSKIPTDHPPGLFLVSHTHPHGESHPPGAGWNVRVPIVIEGH